MTFRKNRTAQNGKANLGGDLSLKQHFLIIQVGKPGFSPNRAKTSKKSGKRFRRRRWRGATTPRAVHNMPTQRPPARRETVHPRGATTTRRATWHPFGANGLGQPQKALAGPPPRGAKQRKLCGADGLCQPQKAIAEPPTVAGQRTLNAGPG